MHLSWPLLEANSWPHVCLRPWQPSLHLPICTVLDTNTTAASELALPPAVFILCHWPGAWDPPCGLHSGCGSQVIYVCGCGFGVGNTNWVLVLLGWSYSLTCTSPQAASPSHSAHHPPKSPTPHLSSSHMPSPRLLLQEPACPATCSCACMHAWCPTNLSTLPATRAARFGQASQDVCCRAEGCLSAGPGLGLS